MMEQKLILDISKKRPAHERRMLKAIWLFVFLLIFEGSFRKWILPDLESLFLVIRDPIALYVLLLGLKHRMLKNTLAKTMMVLGICCFITTMMFGHGDLQVAIYGLRISFIYFPFAFVSGRVLQREDVMKMGKFFLVLFIPIVIVSILQFITPQSSFINRGVGGDMEGSGFSGGALGYYRPAGIFSFIAALTDYYGITFCFLLYSFFFKKDIKLGHTLILVSILFYVISIPISISRTHLFQTVYIIGFSSIALIRAKKRLPIFPLLITGMGSMIFYLIYADTPFLKAFLIRFTGANKTEGGALNAMVERSFGYAIRAIEIIPFWGYGDATFTNFGISRIFAGEERDLLLSLFIDLGSEMEWGRIVGENGALLGFLVIITRVSMAGFLIRKAWKYMKQKQYYLQWFLVSFAAYMLIIGQIKASYNLGFMVVAIMLTLGTMNTKYNLEPLQDK